MIIVSFFAPYGSASLKRIDNNYCPGDEVIYEYNSSIYFYCQFTIGNEVIPFSFFNRREGFSISHSIKSVNLTVIIIQINNTTTTSVVTFHTSQVVW